MCKQSHDFSKERKLKTTKQTRIRKKRNNYNFKAFVRLTEKLFWGLQKKTNETGWIRAPKREHRGGKKREHRSGKK